MAIPAYQDYTNKAKLATAYGAGVKASEFVAEYYGKNQKVPANLREAGYVDTLPPTMGQIAINEKNGVIRIRMPDAGGLGGKSLVFEPSLAADKTITWKCSGIDISSHLLPKDCR